EEKREIPNLAEYTNLTISCSLLGLLRQLIRRLHHFVQKLFEILQAGGRDDDVVAATANVLGDAQEPSAWIFLERKDEGFAFNLHLPGFECVFVDRWFGLTVRPPAKR